jgi:hypothetical protein
MTDAVNWLANVDLPEQAPIFTRMVFLITVPVCAKISTTTGILTIGWI